MRTRSLFLSLALLLAGAGAASAQIAAPLLNPTGTVFAPPINPAVLIWDTPSRIGGEFGRTSIEAGNGNVILNGKSQGAFGTAVGEYVGIGVAGQSVTLDAGPGLGTLKTGGAVVALAGQIKEVVSLGVDQERTRILDTTPSGNGVSQEENLRAAGFTVRLARIFYLGAAGGTVKFSKDPNTFDRKVRRVGVALLDTGKDGGVHLEVFSERKGVAGDATTGTIDKGSVSRGLSAEVMWGSFLLSFQSRRVDQSDVSGIRMATDKFASVSLGWVPSSGLAVVLTRGGFKEEDPNGVLQSRFKSDQLGLAWLF